MTRALLQQALEALELADYHLAPNINISTKLQKPMAAIREYLAPMIHQGAAMTDIVMRLQKHALSDPHDEREVMHAPLLREAADEIETLRAKLETWKTRFERQFDLAEKLQEQLIAITKERDELQEQLVKSNKYADHLGMSLRDVKKERDELQEQLSRYAQKVRKKMSQMKFKNGRTRTYD